MNNDIAISVQNLTKIYKLYDTPLDRLKESVNPFGKKYHKDFYALNDVSFEIKKGETVGIIGKNGSGKSTLLKIITGVLTPSSGNVTVNGKVSALLELGAGFNPELTGIENVYFNGTLMGYTREEMDAKLDDILSFADIGEFVYQPVKSYSSGMFVRLAFAVSTIVNPDVLIVDEALSVGDELFQRKCFAKIKNFSEMGKTVLFVSHGASTVVELCNHALLFDSGELLLKGKPKLVVSLYQKLLYSKPDGTSDVRNEILEVNLANESALNRHQETSQYPPTRIQSLLIEPLNSALSQKAFYVDSLKTETYLEYKAYDVDILNVSINTITNNPVNVLVSNEDYIYSYTVKFNVDVENASFGMCFKTTKGIELGWCAPTLTEHITHVKRGQTYLVEWNFKCILLPGIYYTNASVFSDINNEVVFLNRITDALVFKVQNAYNTPHRGIVSFDQHVNITRL